MDDQSGWRQTLLSVLAASGFRMGALFGLRRYGPMTGTTWGRPPFDRARTPRKSATQLSPREVVGNATKGCDEPRDVRHTLWLFTNSRRATPRTSGR